MVSLQQIINKLENQKLVKGQGSALYIVCLLTLVMDYQVKLKTVMPNLSIMTPFHDDVWIKHMLNDVKTHVKWVERMMMAGGVEITDIEHLISLAHGMMCELCIVDDVIYLLQLKQELATSQKRDTPRVDELRQRADTLSEFSEVLQSVEIPELATQRYNIEDAQKKHAQAVDLYQQKERLVGDTQKQFDVLRTVLLRQLNYQDDFAACLNAGWVTLRRNSQNEHGRSSCETLKISQQSKMMLALIERSDQAAFPESVFAEHSYAEAERAMNDVIAYCKDKGLM